MSLFFVSTPIGNLEDITLRAIRTLREADTIVCEDTRHSGILLKHYEISKPLKSFHSHSTPEQAKKIAQEAKEKHIAYISDAGTPGISDPAYLLIREAVSLGIEVQIIPGPSALLTALVGSGMHMHDFRFLGFLPVKKGRQTLLRELFNKEYTAIIYESPHRIEKTLQDLANTFGPDHHICLARELTKIHESYYRDTIGNLLPFAKEGKFRGEIVVVF